MTKPELPIRHNCISGRNREKWPLKVWFWAGDGYWRNSVHLQFRWRGITYWHMWFI